MSQPTPQQNKSILTMLSVFWLRKPSFQDSFMGQILRNFKTMLKVKFFETNVELKKKNLFSPRSHSHTGWLEVLWVNFI